MVDALILSDMTTTPDGGPTTSTARVAEIVQRYGPDTVVGRFIQRAAPEIHAAVARGQKDGGGRELSPDVGLRPARVEAMLDA